MNSQSKTGGLLSRSYFTVAGFAGTALLLSLNTVTQAAVINNPPTATPATVTGKEDTKVTITLKGADPEKKKLTYALVTQPAHGTVTLKGSVATYIPAANYFNTAANPDRFTFKANDGVLDSSPATVILVVTAVNDAPTAQNASASTVQDTAVDIALIGSDVEGDSLTYVPSKSKKGGTVVVKSGNTVTYTPKKSYLGADSFTFTAKDNNKGVSKAATVSITVAAKPQNLLPTANAGVDQTLNEKTLVTLDGSGSKDSDGTIATYAWKQTAGTTVALTGATTAKPTFTAPDVAADTTLTFELTVTDNKGAVAKDTVNIAVKNIANLSPTANAGVDQTLNEKTLVTLDGSGSKDSDGTLATYAWKQTAGTTVALTGATTAKPTFTAPDVAADTTLTFELTVTDNKGAIAKDTVSILVKAEGILVKPTPTGRLNDTGMTNCFGDSINITCPHIGYLGQDAEYGRDAIQATNNDYDGYAGFSYTKIDRNGYALPANATQWACVKDNVTGLIWEVKQGIPNDTIGDTGLHDPDDRYTWYNPNKTTNGGSNGYLYQQPRGDTPSNICFRSSIEYPIDYCNTNAYVNRVNLSSWCGASDWRMPTENELYSIVDLGKNKEYQIDSRYFPDIRAGEVSYGLYDHILFTWYWSSSPSFGGVWPNTGDIDNAWYVDFDSGNSSSDNKRLSLKVRLVRGVF